MIKKLLLLAGLLGCVLHTYAQQQCGTDEKYWQLLKRNPQIAELEREFEEQLQNALHHHPATIMGKTTAGPDTAYYDVPIVVHIIHDYGTEFLPDNDIYEAVAYWSKVMLCQLPTDTVAVIAPFKPYIGNPRIRLHLATKDPNGNPTKGVTRRQHYTTVNASDDSKMDDWPNNKYINIWFIRNFDPSSSAAAYAYYPSSAAGMPWYDGVIGLASYVNTDKVIPHELGHVLNLQHVWGNTNNAAVACGDDRVDDTPPTKGHTPVGCVNSAIYDTACARGYSRRYTAVGGGDSIANYPDTVNAQNIMDYTYCQKMFTIGQCVRMRAALTSTTAGRNNLITAANVSATGATAPSPDLPPVAEYSVEKASGVGTVTDPRTRFLTMNNSFSFSFRNRSWNDTISAISWAFSNGASTPTSTSTVAVLNKFSIPGWVTTTLTATSNAGATTLVDPQSVYVADTTPIDGHGYFQHFTSAGSISNWPMINYFNNQYKWQWYKGAGIADSTCVRYRSKDTTNKRVASPYGDADDFFTPAFNLSGITGNYYLNFSYAGARVAGSGAGDSLEIQVSTSGGVRWTRIAGLNATQLATGGYSTPEFVPTAAQWRTMAINIPDIYRTRQTFFRFHYMPGELGNNFYMDKFNLYPYPASVEDHIAANRKVTIYPNPSTATGCNLIFNGGNEESAQVLIKDLAGRVIYHNTYTCKPQSINELKIEPDGLTQAGIYFVTVLIDGMPTTEKWIVY
ncbi:MAG: T9SS C-terminal target domain-containing protein [Chitinophagia bacterium]|nr:T9SS C-terminal target domain-containing protein [Chitinophagia bacterium]